MKFIIGDERVDLDFQQTMNTLLRLQNIQKFMDAILEYFKENPLYKNMEEAKSMGLKTDNINNSLESCLYYGKLFVDDLSLIEINYTEEFINNFELEINENYLIRGAGFVLRYLGFATKYCSAISNRTLYTISGEIYGLWESHFTKKLYIPIDYPKRNDRKIIGYDNRGGWGSSKPVYSNEGWY